MAHLLQPDGGVKVCSKCGIEKSLSDFGKMSASADMKRPNCKLCVSSYNKIYSLVNAKAAIQRATAWRTANPEREKTMKIEWEKRNKDRLSTKRKKFYAENKYLWIARRNKNLEREKINHSAWTKANPDRCRTYCQNRRAKLLGSSGTLSANIAEKLFSLQKGKCACGCGFSLKGGYHLDHIVPLALGGENLDRNIQLLRPVCNCQKKAKHPVEFMQERGFLI